MPRPLRHQAANAAYHVTGRGTGPSTIFVDDLDRRIFLRRLAKVEARLGWVSHAICLMETHFHLLVQTPDPNLAAGMHQLNSFYAQSFNRRHGRVGALFQGRYHAVVIDSERHFDEVVRYIADNPVRAGLCERPEDWPWTRC